MPLPSRLTYNDLNGEEIKAVLEERFAKLLAEVPYLQRHITLPRVRMTLKIELDAWADQPTPERQTITDIVEVLDETAEQRPLILYSSAEMEDTVSAAPGRGGQVPDKIRADHGLVIPTPLRGPVAIEDTVENKRMTMFTGAVVDRTGTAAERQNATVVIQDFGVAGLARGQSNRNPVELGNRNSRDGGPVARLAVHEE